jgi:hypothetical protein
MITCHLCGKEITYEWRYVLRDGRVACADHANPWAEGDIKDAAAPADKEQEDGE